MSMGAWDAQQHQQQQQSASVSLALQLLSSVRVREGHHTVATNRRRLLAAAVDLE